jgi:hypothetical protein
MAGVTCCCHAFDFWSVQIDYNVRLNQGLAYLVRHDYAFINSNLPAIVLNTPQLN